MRPKVYFLSIILIALALCKISYSQKTEVPFALSPFIGDTLNQSEKNYYGLYQDFSGFQRALYSVSEDESTLFTKISYSRDGEVKDTVIKQNAEYKGNLIALIRRVDDERMDNWEDAREITLTDVNGNKYTGSFFALEVNRLYMTTAQLNDYSQVINNFRVFDRKEIKSVLVIGKSRNTLSKVGYGFLGGAAIGALFGFAQGNSKDLRELFSKAEEKAAVFGILFGVVGAITGLLASLSVPTDDEMITITNDEDYQGLARFLGSKSIERQVYIIDQE